MRDEPGLSRAVAVRREPVLIVRLAVGPAAAAARHRRLRTNAYRLASRRSRRRAIGIAGQEEMYVVVRGRRVHDRREVFEAAAGSVVSSPSPAAARAVALATDRRCWPSRLARARLPQPPGSRSTCAGAMRRARLGRGRRNPGARGGEQFDTAIVRSGSPAAMRGSEHERAAWSCSARSSSTDMRRLPNRA